ncbi:hypothetical protein ABI59_18615 [Acidobacteria bacterium Mor1]|nr:hypothetical protein ABI59_18615 [Acidobacteria bacterium Mor1]
MTAEQVIELLDLEPLPHEGGAFRETYRASGTIDKTALPEGYTGPRNHSTQIYYLLRSGETSALHRVRSDEVFHHYAGDPVVQLQIDLSTRAATTVVIGKDLAGGERPQVVVGSGVWQGAYLGDGPNGWALMGCTVAPGFDWDDFELVTAQQAQALATDYPDHADAIRTLTPVPGRTRA